MDEHDDSNRVGANLPVWVHAEISAVLVKVCPKAQNHVEYEYKVDDTVRLNAR